MYEQLSHVRKFRKKYRDNHQRSDALRVRYQMFRKMRDLEGTVNDPMESLEHFSRAKSRFYGYKR